MTAARAGSSCAEWTIYDPRDRTGRADKCFKSNDPALPGPAGSYHWSGVCAHIGDYAATSADIRVFSGAAPQSALQDFAREFERVTGHRTEFTFRLVSEIQQRLAAGEKADLIAAEGGGRLRRIEMMVLRAMRGRPSDDKHLSRPSGRSRITARR
jgi:hypothetical protein